MESDIHIFVLPRERGDEPSNLIQSVSMEIERLHTLSESGRKSERYVAVYAENDLLGKMGGVCEGLLIEKRETGHYRNSMQFRKYSNLHGNFA